MRLTPKSRFWHSKLIYAAMILIVPLIIASLACSVPSFGGGGASLQETDIALGIQQTFIVQTSTALNAGQATPVTPTAEPPTQPPQEQQMSPTPTTPPASDTPSASPTQQIPATTAPPPAPDKIKITDWGMQYWAYLSSGCRTTGEPCWKANDDYNKHFGMSDLILVSKQPIKVELSWPSPYLVFYHKYKTQREARIDVQSDTNWITVRDMTKKNSGGAWRLEAINLRDFKGKEILVRFSSQGIWGSGGIPGSQWFVTEVYVIPNYTP